MKRIPFIFTLLIFNIVIYSCSVQLPLNNYSNVNHIKTDLFALTNTSNFRNYKNIEVLDSVAGYIFSELSESCDTVYFQEYFAEGNKYRNIVGVKGINKKERIIVGAHYDVCGNQQGADDNASGVAGLLELSRLLNNDSLNYRIDFVAFTLEEPPYFRTEHMGSYIHAKYLHDNNVQVKGMICLEMIGYFSDNENSQNYPIGIMKLYYGNKGDYIAVVQKNGNGSFGRKFCKLMKEYEKLPTKSLKAPAFVSGIDFSDHLNYWKYGYSAVMVTNTAFYRNNNYHKITDKVETLDTERMCKVIDEIYLSIKNF